jgi:hypothetical protein
MRERIRRVGSGVRRFIFGVILFLVLLIALTLLLQAVQDSPEDEVRTVTT